VRWHPALIVGPAHVATGDHGGGVVGNLTGNTGEVLSPADAGVQRIDEFLGLVFGADLVGRDEDVAHTALVDEAGHAAAHVHQFDQVEAAGAAHRAHDIAALHGRHQFDE